MKKALARINYQHISDYNQRLVYLSDLYKSHKDDPIVMKVIEHDYVTGRSSASNRFALSRFHKETDQNFLIGYRDTLYCESSANLKLSQDYLMNYKLQQT